ncbi:sigma 54-interacting transcriptional regulator [Pseudoduganella sp. LjRoot289]|uniref:sigma 54-interacting transcriptional regulator n=1 Tax=Pseudoduganella sp. LjRoot289 TaxID=3342314 RepID=UPI003ECF1D2B
MERLDALAVWLHLVGQAQQEIARALVLELDKTGIKTQALQLPAAPAGSFGIVLFSAWDDGLAEQVMALSARATVLAISCGSAPPAADAMWAALAAGASDLLQWPVGAGTAATAATASGPNSATATASATAKATAATAGIIAAQAAARLRRWHAVQQLMDSDLVQACLVGDSPVWRALVRNVVEVAAFSQSPVLITGETGTGKEQIAQLIHRLGGARGELVVLDCTTLSAELSGSEFFGHERGAFTGAANARDGAFALADGGILFLDEVGELPLAMQAQLLRVIQEQKYKRVGSNTWQPTRFRLVCATNRDLEAGVADGSFRADLYYRIAGWRCRPPPLRERQGDILPLARHFIRLLAPEGPGCELDPAVRDYLLTRDYPGNVRDLRQTVARIWHRHCGPGPVTIGDVPPDERPHGASVWPDSCFANAVRHAVDMGVGLGRITQAAGDMAIQLVLEQEGDNNQRAAARLGVTDRALQLRRKAWGEMASYAGSAPPATRPAS